MDKEVFIHSRAEHLTSMLKLPLKKAISRAQDEWEEIDALIRAICGEKDDEEI